LVRAWANSRCKPEKLQQSFIQTREESIIENKLIVCSIYLDPRIRRALLKNPTSHMLARATLKQPLIQIVNFKNGVGK